MENKKLGVNPWTSIWFHPRKTIRAILDYNPKHRFAILSFIYGLPMLFQIAQNLSLGDTYSILGIVIVAIVLATFVGMLAITVASALLLWTGKWIGGKGSYYGIRAAVSWSNVPNLIAIIVWIVLLAMFGREGVSSSFENMDFAGMQMKVASSAIIVQAIISIWAFILLVKGLGEAQGFSAWKGVLNVLIPFFLIGIVIWAISWLFWMSIGIIGLY